MRVSLRWLKQFLTEDLSVPQLIETLTSAGFEVEEQWDLGFATGKIVVARVLEARPHPDADRLKLCKVDAGGDAPRSIVCGAPVIQVGGNYACALPGARLPDGMIIEERKVRGQVSQGMLCSARELGLGSDHDGILPLPEEFKIGEPFDYLLEVKITPNRPDCLSILGLARDVGAVLGRKVFPPTPRFKEMLDHIDRYVHLTVKERSLCPRYTCRLIRDVKVGESPLWLKRALECAGLRPINNVVDVTNYVLLELGHPLHAFDFDRLQESQVNVRLARAGEKMTLIDGKELELNADDLVIADAGQPVALAGVMGGRDSEVGAGTTNVLIESAYFDPATVRKSARHHGLQTDSSYRFERGTDRARLALSLNRATQLMQELAEGEVTKGYLDVQGTVIEPPPIMLELKRVNGLLGLELSSTEIADYLVNLGFEIRSSDRERMMIAVPSHRVDVTRDVDLIEEVARLHNYNRIPVTMPRIVPPPAEASAMNELVEATRDGLAALGFCEAVHHSFMSEQEARPVGFDPARQPRVANPLAADQAIMRPSLLPALLRSVAFNQKQDEPRVALFEVGKVWRAEAGRDEAQWAGDENAERIELAAALAGPIPPHWSRKPRIMDFYDMKGALSVLATQWTTGMEAMGLEAEPLGASTIFHPGRSARLHWRGEAVGAMGEIHPDLAITFDLRGAVLAAHLDLSRVVGLMGKRSPQFRPIPKFPGSWRDLALVVARERPAGTLLKAVRAAGGELVEDVQLFDVYQGEHIPAEQKSLALRLRLRSPERTLTEDEINETIERIVKKLKKEHGAELRA